MAGWWWWLAFLVAVFSLKHFKQSFFSMRTGGVCSSFVFDFLSSISFLQIIVSVSERGECGNGCGGDISVGP